MRHLLAIILLFSLALPGAGWSRMIADPSCLPAKELNGEALKASHCSCCEVGHCACAESGNDLPAKPLPSLPLRSVSGTDHIVNHGETAIPVPSPMRTGVGTFMRPMWQISEISHLAVPIYIRHCAQLW